MTRTTPLHRSSFAVAVALLAAALSDPLVETISNTGAFGRAFVDSSQQGVVPVLLAGLVAVAALVGFRAWSLLARRNGRLGSLRDTVIACADRVDPRSLAPVFAAQLAIVYAMECCEVAFGSGQAIAGLSWLGGPVAVSLCLHFSVCVATALVVKAGARFFLARVVAVITYALERLIAERARGARRPLSARAATRVPSRFELLCARRLRGRAPPILAATA